MAFPYPENPDNWQTAYTREHANRDFKIYGIGFMLPIMFLFLMILIYIFFNPTVFLLLEKYSLTRSELVMFLIAFLSFLLFVIVPTYSFASRFLSEFYLLPNDIEPSKLILYRLFGKTKLLPPLNIFLPYEYIIAKNGEIDKRDNWASWPAFNIGGPVWLLVSDECALYIERGNRFSRVVGPGNEAFLEWGETIKYVVDLRKKSNTGNFDVWTKDGIFINLTVRIEYRIGDPRKTNPKSVYPYDPVAVKKAIEIQSVRWPDPTKEPSEFTWEDAAWGQVTGVLPSYIGSRFLDDLYIANRRGGQFLSPAIIEEIFYAINIAANGFGVFITDFQILKVDIPQEVYEHQIEYFKAEEQKVTIIRDAQEKALSIRSQEKARADAQRDLILTIADSLKKNTDNSIDKDNQYTDALLSSLSEILDGIKDPMMRDNIANEALDTLVQLQEMLN